jgi:HK97 family phage major capsid protein
MELSEIKTAVIEGVTEASKGFAQGLETLKKDVGTIQSDLTSLKGKVEKIEAMPIGEKKVNVNTIDHFYKGYDLRNQGITAKPGDLSIREKAEKNPKAFRVFGDDAKFYDYSKFMIDFIRANMKNANINEVMEFQGRYKSTMLGQTDARGGYLVPDEFQWDMIQLVRDSSFALQKCTVINMGSDTLRLPSELTLASVAWITEANAITSSAPTFGQVVLTAKKLAGLTDYVANELLQDSAIDIVSMISEQFSFAIQQELDNQVLNGTGTPISGVLTAKASYSVVMGTGSTNFSSINADKLSQMISQIKEQDQAQATFVWNKLIQHYIRTLKDVNGNYIWQKPSEGKPGSVWEIPYYQSEKAPSTTGTSTYFVALGNFKCVYIGRRLGAMTLDVDPYGGFGTDMTRYRMVTRWGMEVARTTAFSRLATAGS